jgi:dihydrofolate synthase/folylpolyglutamate synthase
MSKFGAHRIGVPCVRRCARQSRWEMGGHGRSLDTANVINAPVAVITPIGIDHVEYLSDDIAGIAGEKAKSSKALGLRPVRGNRSHRGRCRSDGSAVGPICARRRRGRPRGSGSRFWAVRSRSADGCCSCRVLAGCTPTSTCRCMATQAHNAVVALAAVEAFSAPVRRQPDVSCPVSTPPSPARPAGGMRSAPRCSSMPRTIRQGHRAGRDAGQRFDFRFWSG